MEFLTDSLKDDHTKLNDEQKEEVDIVESIINTNEANKESIKKENRFSF